MLSEGTGELSHFRDFRARAVPEANAPSPEHESERPGPESENREGRVGNWKEPSQKVQAKCDNTLA